MVLDKNLQPAVWCISAILLACVAIAEFCEDWGAYGLTDFTRLFVFLVAVIYLIDEKGIKNAVGFFMLLAAIVLNPWIGIRFGSHMMLYVYMFSFVLFAYLSYLNRQSLACMVCCLWPKKKKAKRKRKK